MIRRAFLKITSMALLALPARLLAAARVRLHRYFPPKSAKPLNPKDLDQPHDLAG